MEIAQPSALVAFMTPSPIELLLVLILGAFLFAGVVAFIVILAKNPGALKALAIITGIGLAILFVAALFLVPLFFTRVRVERGEALRARQRAEIVQEARRSRELRQRTTAGVVETVATEKIEAVIEGTGASTPPPRPQRVPEPSFPRQNYPHRIAAPDDGEWRKASDTDIAFEVMAGAKSDWGAEWAQDSPGSRRREGAIGDTLFAYCEPGPTGHLVGYSGVELTRADAEQEALAAAARKLAVLALIELKRENRSLNLGEIEPLARKLAAMPAVDFSRPQHQSTRHGTAAATPWLVQEGLHFERGTLPRTGQTVYRAAARVRAGEEQVAKLAAEVRREIQRGWLAEQKQLRGVLVTGFSLLVLAFAVFLIYTFLNAGTKGHFAWPLRIVSMLVFALLCVAILYARSQLGEREAGRVREPYGAIERVEWRQNETLRAARAESGSRP
jgi:hypothetical protein